MDNIPIFSGDKEDDLDSWLTCGQFLSLIEDYGNRNNLSETQMREYFCLNCVMVH